MCNLHVVDVPPLLLDYSVSLHLSVSKKHHLVHVGLLVLSFCIFVLVDVMTAEANFSNPNPNPPAILPLMLCFTGISRCFS